MKILFLASDCYGGHGGIAQYCRDLIDALALMSDVSEIQVVPRVISRTVGPLPDKVAFYPEVAGSKIKYILRSAAIWASNIDLVVCAHINLLPLAVALSRLKRRPIVLVVYGIDVWRAPSRHARALLRQVNAVWSISTITRDRMNEWAELPPQRYTLLPNAIHLERYGVAPKNQNLIHKYRLEGATVIMTLCRLPSAERYKGVDEVLECLPRLMEAIPSLKYLVAGDGNDRGRLEAKAEALGLQDRVIFAGMVDEQEKADHFRLGDAFVMPGSGEGFGFVFLEALACGVPAVGSMVDGSREALRQGALGELADPRDHDSICRAVLSALGKPKQVPSELGHFAWPAFAKRVSDAARRARQCA